MQDTTKLRNRYVTLKQLGKSLGISAIEVGNILITRGYRYISNNIGIPTRKAIRENLCTKKSSHNLKWHFDKTSTIIKEHLAHVTNRVTSTQLKHHGASVQKSNTGISQQHNNTMVLGNFSQIGHELDLTSNHVGKYQREI